MRRIAAFAAVATLVFTACGTSAAPSVAPSVAPSPTSTAPPTASPTPSPTPVPTVTDLMADPLPVVTEDQVAAIALAGHGESALSLCQKPPAEETPEEQLILRREGCLQAIGLLWLKFQNLHFQSVFDDARTVYAYAAQAMGPTERRGLDEILVRELPELSSTPDPTPDPASLKTAERLLGTKQRKRTAPELATAVHAALRTDFQWFVSAWGPVVGSSDGTVLRWETATVTACTHPPEEAWSPEVGTAGWCESVVGRMWRGYRATGKPQFYDAALIAFQYGYAAADAYCRDNYGGTGCSEHYVDDLRRMLPRL